MKSVIAAMLLWIGANTSYNVDLKHPEIRMLPQNQLEMIYSHGRGMGGAELHAFYDIKNHVIYLKDSFDLKDPWQQGILLHELLHYVQDQNRAKFECSAATERETWPLQKQFLWEHFNIRWNYDEFWLKIISACHYG